MRRNIRDRVQTLAPFLTFDPDPYMVVGDDGRLSWMIDAYTTADSFPYARHYLLGSIASNYISNSVKVVIDAYDGTTTFYVFDKDDPVIAAYRSIFPTLFKDASAMPPALRKHVRYPELLLKLQAAVYGLYHMTEPGVFYNREDLWSCRERGRPEPAARASRAADGAELRADDAARARRRPSSSRSCRSRRRTATTSSAGLPAEATTRTTARRSSTTFRRPGSSTAPCRSRRASIRTRSCQDSCLCGTSRDRTYGAAR